MDGSALPDKDLIDEARRGTAFALEAIMRRHNRRLFRVARAIVKDEAEAEEVVQDAYLRAFTRLDQLQGPAALSAWLTRITVNEALQRLRQRRRAEALTGMLDQPASPFDPERLAASREVKHLVEQAIDRLPDEFRAVFVLRCVEQLSVAETAECLGIPPETVKSRLFRARALMRRALGGVLERLLPSTFPFAGARCDRIVRRVLAALER